jgi:hypothetical protein
MSEPEKEILPAFIHWTFFETIDEDLYAYSRYLEFNPKNYGAFSINLARLYSPLADLNWIKPILGQGRGMTSPTVE